MLHLTLNTGHVRESPRGEVGDDVIAALRPVLLAEGGPLPHPPGYVLGVARVGGGEVYTISSVMGTGDPEPVPLVTCWLAREDAEAVWRQVPSVTAGVEMPDRVPWLAVLLHPTALLRPDALSWLGDAERCIAWALMEERIQ